MWKEQKIRAPKRVDEGGRSTHTLAHWQHIHGKQRKYEVIIMKQQLERGRKELTPIQVFDDFVFGSMI